MVSDIYNLEVRKRGGPKGRTMGIRAAYKGRAEYRSGCESHVEIILDILLDQKLKIMT
jgi:hypothetical protein